jgi:hypothetical protein
MYFHIRYSVVVLDRNWVFDDTVSGALQCRESPSQQWDTQRRISEITLQWGAEEDIWEKEVESNWRLEIAWRGAPFFCTPPQIFPSSYRGQCGGQGHVAHVGEERNAYRFWWEKVKGRDHLQDPRVDGRQHKNLRWEDFANSLFRLSTSFSGEFTEIFHVLPCEGSTRFHTHTKYGVFKGCCCRRDGTWGPYLFPH